MLLRSRLQKALFFLFLILIVPTHACKSHKKITLEFETEVFEKSFQGCNPESEDCTHVKMSYPKFTKGTDAEALQRINNEVKNFLETPLEKGPPQSPEAFAKKLFADYLELKKEFPDAPYSFTVERNVKGLQLSPEVLNLEMSQYSFLGGAHPNSFESYLNLDPKTGKKYELKDLFQPDYGAKLNAIAEKIFRKNQNIPSGENLEEAGFFFEGGIFKLNDNFLITQEGLKFLYNPYEAAPYVMGPIEIVIPYEKLQSILKKGAPVPHKKES